MARSMTRRHFFEHLALGGAGLGALEFLAHVQTHAAEVKKRQKACILMWLGGGPPTIDMWDLKPGSKNGGEFKPISTKGDLQISESLPKTALVMDRLSVVRSMSTREADHNRGRYYLHTAYVPNPTVVHPTFGSVVSYELGSQRSELQIPAFVSIGEPSGSAGYLGMSHAPFLVDPNGRVQNAGAEQTSPRLGQRLAMLDVIESGFINSDRGELPQGHKDVYSKAVNLMTSAQMRSFQVAEEPAEVQDAYGRNPFGQGLLMARRLVETGVPFVEVGFPGSWDLHQDVFNSLRTRLMPNLDQGIAAITNDLAERGMLDNTVLICMGEFGRTPRINQNVGRDHWAASWSVLMGGGGLHGGRAIGETDADGLSIVGKSYVPGDVWATAAQALGIPLETVHKSKNGRPMKIANGGRPIDGLIG